MKKIRIISVPFSLISLPSLETATIKATLNKFGIEAISDVFYVRYADFMGGDAYREMRVSELGELVFSSLLFPELHEKHKLYWHNNAKSQQIDFERSYKKTYELIEQYLRENCFENEILLFYIYTKQLIPALYLAKRIKMLYGNVIWLAGYCCQGEPAKLIKNNFPFIDECFGTDIEIQLLEKLRPNVSIFTDTLDFLGIPDYSDYFAAIKRASQNFQDEVASYYCLQIEFSRGCWWNKCSFCTLNCKSTCFREKTVERLENEYYQIINQYNTTSILPELFVCGSHWREQVKAVSRICHNISLYLNFKVCQLSDYKDFELLKEVKAVILIGTESFSEGYLAQMQKGQSILDNILVLKYSERSGVPCCHNLMYGLPFEKEEYYKETKEVISYIYHLPPPFDIEKFRLTYGSEIYTHPEVYGISRIDWRDDAEEKLYPAHLKTKLLPFFFNFETENVLVEEKKWKSLIDEWRDRYYMDVYRGEPQRTKLLLMRKTKNLVEIQDFRYLPAQKMYKLAGVERDVYEFCDIIRTKKDIIKKFGIHEGNMIQEILNRFIENKLMIADSCERYLSLAI